MRSTIDVGTAAGTRARRLAVSLLAACALSAPGIAQAHARLVSSEPPDGASLSAPPATITLTFDSRVERNFARLRLIGPAGESTLSAGSGEAVQSLVVQLPSLDSGDHRLAYSVVSADGHRIEGTVRFSVEK